MAGSESQPSGRNGHRPYEEGIKTLQAALNEDLTANGHRPYEEGIKTMRRTSASRGRGNDTELINRWQFGDVGLPASAQHRLRLLPPEDLALVFRPRRNQGEVATRAARARNDVCIYPVVLSRPSGRREDLAFSCLSYPRPSHATSSVGGQRPQARAHAVRVRFR